MAKKPIPLHQRLRAALRRVWSMSPERYAVLKASRTSPGRYRCAQCMETFKVNEVQIDHVIPCGKLLTLEDLSPFAERLFLGEQVTLCRPCHAAKTAEERKNERKSKSPKAS